MPSLIPTSSPSPATGGDDSQLAPRGGAGGGRAGRLPETRLRGGNNRSLVRRRRQVARGATAADPGVAAWNRWIVKTDGDQSSARSASLAARRARLRRDGLQHFAGRTKMGYATEAAADARFCFFLPDRQARAAMCREDNAASIKVLERNGYSRTDELGPMWAWEKKRPKRGKQKPENWGPHGGYIVEETEPRADFSSLMLPSLLFA